MAGTYTITVLPAHYHGSESGNRTLGICVTGRDVTNYTKSDEGQGAWQAAPDIFLKKNNFPGFFEKKNLHKSFWNFPFATSLRAAAFGMFLGPSETKPKPRVGKPIYMKQRRDEIKIIN